MKSRFKSNDFFAILIAVALIAIGFILLFIHEQSSLSEAHAPNETAGATSVALMHARIGASEVETQSKSEFQRISESIDFPEAPIYF